MPSDGPFLARILILCQVPLGEFDGAFCSQFSRFTWNRFSRIRILRYTTQLYRFLQCSTWSYLHHLSSFSCLAFLLLQHVGNGICRHVHILFQIFNSDTREGARIYMTDCYRILIGMEFHSYQTSFPVYCLISGKFLSSPSACFAFEWDAREDDRPFRLWPCPLFRMWKHPPTWTMCFPPLPHSCQRRLSFLCDSWWLIPFPQHRSGLWRFESSSSCRYGVLKLSSICDSSIPWFAPFLVTHR